MLTKKRVAYALAAGAVVGVGDAFEVEADIVWSGNANITLALGYSQPLRFDGDPIETAPNDLELKNLMDPYVGFTGNFQGVFSPSGGTGFVGFTIGSGSSALTYASALNAGFEVNATNTGQGHFTGSLAFGMNHPNAQFNNAVDKFIGFSFATIDGDPRFHMGWIRVSINNASGAFLIRDWAFQEGLGVPILTGDTGLTTGDFDFDGDVDGRDFLEWQRGNSPTSTSAGDLADWQNNYGTGPLVATTAVPEPATLGLLAAGSTGVALLRRFRKR